MRQDVQAELLDEYRKNRELARALVAEQAAHIESLKGRITVLQETVGLQDQNLAALDTLLRVAAGHVERAVGTGKLPPTLERELERFALRTAALTPHRRPR